MPGQTRIEYPTPGVVCSRLIWSSVFHLFGNVPLLSEGHGVGNRSHLAINIAQRIRVIHCARVLKNCLVNYSFHARARHAVHTNCTFTTATSLLFRGCTIVPTALALKCRLQIHKFKDSGARNVTSIAERTPGQGKSSNPLYCTELYAHTRCGKRKKLKSKQLRVVPVAYDGKEFFRQPTRHGPMK